METQGRRRRKAYYGLHLSMILGRRKGLFKNPSIDIFSMGYSRC